MWFVVLAVLVLPLVPWARRSCYCDGPSYGGTVWEAPLAVAAAGSLGTAQKGHYVNLGARSESKRQNQAKTAPPGQFNLAEAA